MRILSFFMLFLGLTVGMQAQQKESKKVVIIKKTVDDKGNVNINKEEATGADADEIIKKMKEDGTLEGIDINILEGDEAGKTVTLSSEKEVNVEKSIVNGKEVTKYKIKINNDGEEKVLEWNGEGEMPAEMKEAMENVEIKTLTKDGQQMMFIQADDTQIKDGETRISVNTENDKYTFVEIQEEKSSDNKVQLGVMIEDDSNGVVVSDIIKDSAADKNGIKKGDTILKVDDTYIFNLDGLLKALSVFESGDKSKLTILRDGKEKKIKIGF